MASGALPEWQTFAGKSVTVHAPQGSYPAGRAAAELRDAEKAIAALEALLSPPPDRLGPPVEVYLTDAVVEEGSPITRASEEEGLLRVVQPENPGAPIVYDLARLLVGRWFGPQAARASLFVDGIAGIAGSRLGSAPSMEEADEAVRAELAGGGEVSVFAPDPGLVVPISFVGFLLKTHGPEPLRRFLETYDPDRRDQAATEVYQRPLGSLEELWLSSLRELTGFRTTLGALLGHLRPLMRPYRWRWVEILVYMLLTVGLTIAIPLGFKYLFDTIIPDASVSKLGVFVGVLFAIFIANALITMRRSYVTAVVNQRVLFGLQERMFERLQLLSHNFYGRAKVGDLMARLSQDLNTVQEATTAVLSEGLLLVLTALAAAITALVLSPILGALVLVVVPLFCVSYVLLLSRLRSASFEVQTIYGQVASTIQENLSAHSVVKAFGLERRAIGAYRGAIGGLLRAIVRVVVLSTLFETSIGIAVTFGQLVIIGVGGYLVIKGHMSLGTLVAFVGLLPSFLQPITTLANVGQQVQRAAGAFDRMLEVLDEPIAIEERPDAEELPRVPHEIRLEGVGFGYEPSRPILRDLEPDHPRGHARRDRRSLGIGEEHRRQPPAALLGPAGRARPLRRPRPARAGDRIVPRPDRARLPGHLPVRHDAAREHRPRTRRGDGRGGARGGPCGAARGLDRVSPGRSGHGARRARRAHERRPAPAPGDRARAPARSRRPHPGRGDERARRADGGGDPRDPGGAGSGQDDDQHHAPPLAVGARRLDLRARPGGARGAGNARGAGAGGRPVPAPVRRADGVRRSRARARGDRGRRACARSRSSPISGRRSWPSSAERLTEEQFPAGEDVVRQGEAGRKLYLVASGQVEVVVQDGARERRVNALNEGDFFGEMALLADEPRAATVRTTMPTQLYSLARVDFLSLLDHDPDARQAITERIAARQRALAQARAATRVAPLPLAQS